MSFPPLPIDRQTVSFVHFYRDSTSMESLTAIPELAVLKCDHILFCLNKLETVRHEDSDNFRGGSRVGLGPFRRTVIA